MSRLLSPKELLRARKLMKRDFNRELTNFELTRAMRYAAAQIEDLDFSFTSMPSSAESSLRLFSAFAHREFMFASRAIAFRVEAAFQDHRTVPNEGAVLSFYGFHLRQLEYERTVAESPNRSSRHTSGYLAAALLAPLLCASKIPSSEIESTGDSLVGFYQLAKDLERYDEYFQSDDPQHAQTEIVGTAAFAASALALARDYELPVNLVFPDDPGELALEGALNLILGDEEDARAAYTIAMERHAYRAVMSKPHVELIRWPGMMPYPFEYLILKQIRSCQGLENPPFEHVLLYPEYEKLHNAFTWFDPRAHPVMGQFIRLYEDWSGERFDVAWPPVEIPN